MKEINYKKQILVNYRLQDHKKLQSTLKAKQRQQTFWKKNQ